MAQISLISREIFSKLPDFSFGCSQCHNFVYITDSDFLIIRPKKKLDKKIGDILGDIFSNLNSTNFAIFWEKSPTFPYCKIEKQNHELKIKNKKIALTRV